MWVNPPSPFRQPPSHRRLFCDLGGEGGRDVDKKTPTVYQFCLRPWFYKFGRRLRNNTGWYNRFTLVLSVKEILRPGRSNCRRQERNRRRQERHRLRGQRRLHPEFIYKTPGVVFTRNNAILICKMDIIIVDNSTTPRINNSPKQVFYFQYPFCNNSIKPPLSIVCIYLYIQSLKKINILKHKPIYPEPRRAVRANWSICGFIVVFFF